MANSLPTVGGDSGTWGTKLNAYLSVEHNSDGTHGNPSGMDLLRNYANVATVDSGGKGEYTTIQAAITALSSSGGTVIIGPGTYSEQITLANGVNLVGIGQPIIQFNSANNGSTITDNNVACTCILENLSIARDKPSGTPSNAYGVWVQNSNSEIKSRNVEVASSVSDGIYVAAGTIRGFRSSATASSSSGIHVVSGGIAYNCIGEDSDSAHSGFWNGGTAENCSGRATSGYGFFNSVTGLASWCDGRSSGANTAFMNYGNATSCKGRGVTTNGFECSSDTAPANANNCSGWSVSGPGFQLADLSAGNAKIAKAIGCSGYSDTGAGFNPNTKTGRTFAIGCFGASRTGTGYIQSGDISVNCAGQSDSNYGYTLAAGKAINCSGSGPYEVFAITGAAMALNCSVTTTSADTTSGAFLISNAGAALINCSADCVNGMVPIKITTTGGYVLGGTYINRYNNAAGHGINLAVASTTGNGPFIRGVTFRLVNASAYDVYATAASSYAKVTNCSGSNGLSPNVVQNTASTPDAQGNIWG